MNMPRRQVIRVLLVIGWLILWSLAWHWPTQPRPVTRIELPATAALLSVSDSGLASVTTDAAAPPAIQQSMAKVWDMKTGQEIPLPFRPGDVRIDRGLSYQVPCFVFRNGCVQRIDAITGDTLQRYEELRSAVQVLASPDGLRLLVERVPMTFDLFDITTGKVIWTHTRTEPTSWYWSYSDFLVFDGTSEKRLLLVDASTGQSLKGAYSGLPLQLAQKNGQILAVDLFGANGLQVIDVQSNQVLIQVPFIRSDIGFPDRKQLRFSADGSSLLLDYIDKQGKVATANWKLDEQVVAESVDFSPFKVAANGSVLETRAVEHPKWLAILRRSGRSWLGASPAEQLQSTVFDPSGKQLLQITHTYTDLNSLEEYAALIDGGQGLVVYNNQGLEYYRIPNVRPAWMNYWLGWLIPVLAWWGNWRSRKPNPHPIETIG